MELMDGHSNVNHISSEDWSCFNEAVHGVKNGVFDWGDRFALKVIGPNNATLGKGAGLVDGKRVWAKMQEQVAIESGTQGTERIDVVGILYKADGQGVETAAVKVLKGIPAIGVSPVLPNIPDGFLPLWQVKLSGVNVGTPSPMFTRIASSEGLKGSVSSLESDSGWRNLWVSADGHINIKARKIGRWVTVNGKFRNQDIGTDWRSITTLPAGMRPGNQTYFAGTAAAGDHVVQMDIEADGIIYAKSMEGTVSGALFSATFIAEN